MPYKNIKERRACQARYYRSSKGRATYNKYAKSVAGRSSHAKARSKYEKSSQGRARLAAYAKSPKGKARDKRHRMKIKLETLQHYGGKCACCGEVRHEFLAIDHTNGGGNEHRRKLGLSGWNFYRWLRDNGFPAGYRVLCHNCNMSLGLFGYCPHLTSS
jgi:hypothetical protein